MKTSFLKYFYYFCLILLSLGQFTAFSRGQGGDLYLFDIFVFAYAIIGFIYFLSIKKKFLIPKNSIFLILFIFSATTSLLANLTTLSFFESVYSSFYLIRFLLYFLASLVVYNLNQFSLLSLIELKNSIYYSALLISVVGFFQLILLPDFTVLDPSLGWDPHKNRLASSFFDPNFTGGYLAISLGLFLSDMIDKSKKDKKASKLNSKQVILFFIIPLVALFLTFSRSSWGMFAVIILVQGLFKSKKLLFLAIILAFLTYFAVPRVQTRIAGTTDPSDSAAFRLISWSNALTIIKDHPVIGIGFNTYRYAQREYSFFEVGSIGGNAGSGADSSFMFIAATTGIIGLIFFTIYYFSPVFDFKNIALVSIILGLFLHSQFVNSLFYPQFMFVLFSIINLKRIFYS